MARRHKRPASSAMHFSAPLITSSNLISSSHQMLPLLLLILLLSSPFAGAYSSSSMTTAKPSASGLLSAALSSAASSSSSSSSSGSSGALASALSSAAGSGSGSGASGSQGGALGAASSFLYNVMRAPAPTAANPYPIRTMIGNLYFRLRQHKTPIMVIPPLIRLMYQFRTPIMNGVSTAFKGLSASGAASSVAKEVATSAGAAAAASQLPGLVSSAANTFGNPAMGPGGLMFPGPFSGGIPMGIPGFSAAAAPVFQPTMFKRK